MPTLAQRAHWLPASPIRKLAPAAEAAKARGLKVFGLNIGQPDLETPKQYWEAINNAKIETLAYSPSEGFLSYRQALSAYYERFGVSVSPADVLVTTGGSEALLFGLMACCDPGNEVLIPEPFYANYNSFATLAGLTVKPIPTYVENSFELPEPEAFEALITPRTRAIIICNPSNPTGKVYDKPALEKLLTLCQQHDLYLMADEVYKEFVYDGKTFTSILSLPNAEDYCLVVDSVSKRFSACGARVGSLVTRNEAVRAAALKMAQARLSPPTLGQVGGEALTHLPDSYFEGVRTEYVKRRDIVLEYLQQIPGVVCPKVSGAFYVFPQLPVDDSERFAKWLLEDFSHENTTLMVAPGPGFYSTPGQGKQHVRIAYVLQESDLRTAMEGLTLALEQYPGTL